MKTYQKILGVLFIIMIIIFIVFIIIYTIKHRKKSIDKVGYIKENLIKERLKDTKSTVVFDKLGNNGNFGNQLFQIAAVIGLGTKYNCNVSFPDKWKYNKYFISDIPETPYKNVDVNIKETDSAYIPIEIKNDSRTYSIDGYFQSDKYFNFCADKIRKLFTFNSEYIKKVKSIIPSVDHPNSIGLHIRRGDTITKQYKDVYQHCSPIYYKNAVEYIKNKNKNEDLPIIICSDDIEYCKKEIGPLFYNNVVYSKFTNDPDGQLLDFITLMLCKHEVMAVSSYSWWSSWLKQGDKNIIISPKPWYKNGHDIYHNTDDIYCDNWILFDPNNGKNVRNSLIKERCNFLTNLYNTRCTSNIDIHPQLGRCYVVGLDNEINRVKNATTILHKLGINPAHFRAINKSISENGLNSYYDIGILSKNNDYFKTVASGFGTVGCLMSHVSIWGNAYINNYDRVTIFEDDIFTHISKEKLDDLMLRFDKLIGDEWDVLYLGRCYDKCSYLEKIDENIYRTHCPNCTHAYMVSKRGLDKLLHMLPYKTGIDAELASFSSQGVLKTITFHPSVFIQDVVKYSSNLRSLKYSITNMNDCMIEE